MIYQKKKKTYEKGSILTPDEAIKKEIHKIHNLNINNGIFQGNSLSPLLFRNVLM